MASQHTITNASEVFRGNNYNAYYADTLNYNGRGVKMPRLAAVNYGAVITADPDGICQAQNGTDAGAMTMNGALVSGGVAVLDVPRALVVDSGGADTAVITITGTDQYGAPMSEAITLNGTTAVLGQKAFKTITSVARSATISNNAFVGTTDILGLPFRIDAKSQVLVAAADGVAETNTIVVADTTAATTTTNDVRGTIDFNTAANDTVTFSALLLISESDGSEAVFGVAQA